MRSPEIAEVTDQDKWTEEIWIGEIGEPSLAVGRWSLANLKDAEIWPTTNG